MAKTAISEISNPFRKLGWIVAGGGGRTDDLKIALSPKEEGDIESGDLCSQNPATNLVEKGLLYKNSMPLWSVNNIDAYDVANTEYGFAKGSPYGFGNGAIPEDMTQYGQMNFVVGARSYEMFTTSYDDSEYTPDSQLVASSTAGNVIKGAGPDGTVDGALQIVGQVSRGKISMPDRVHQDLPDVLFFWSMSQKARS